MITEGIIWEKKDGQWVKVLDNWPAGRRGARILANTEAPFGEYSKSAAIDKVEEFIASSTLPEHYYRFTVIPGKQMSDESKEKLKEFTTSRKVERGELEPVESYISTD